MRNLVLATLVIPTLAFADLGITDTTSEAAAKNEAAGLGISTIYDHPNNAPNGQFVVPIQYNRTNPEGNGAEHDPNDSKPNDIDYVPLTQLKGAKGDNGNTGVTGDQGTKGDVGAKGSKGDDGKDGKDANIETRMLAGVAVKVVQEKHFDVESFMDYDVTNGKVGFFGMRLVFKPGKSYEQRQIEKQQKEIDSLKLLLKNAVR